MFLLKLRDSSNLFASLLPPQEVQQDARDRNDDGDDDGQTDEKGEAEKSSWR